MGWKTTAASPLCNKVFFNKTQVKFVCNVLIAAASMPQQHLSMAASTTTPKSSGWSVCMICALIVTKVIRFRKGLFSPRAPTCSPCCFYLSQTVGCFIEYACVLVAVAAILHVTGGCGWAHAAVHQWWCTAANLCRSVHGHSYECASAAGVCLNCCGFLTQKHITAKVMGDSAA